MTAPGGARPVSGADLSHAVIQVLGTGVLVVAVATVREGSPWVYGAYLVTLLCWFLYLLLERRRPGWAGIAVVLGAAVSAAAVGPAEDSTAVIAVCVVLGRFAAWATPRGWQLGVAVAGCLGLTVGSSLLAGRSVEDVLGYALLVLVLTLLGLNRRQHRLRAEQSEVLLRQSLLVRREQARAAALDERARIAREIHDVLAHSLGALSVQLKVVDALLERGDRAAARERVRRCHQLAEEGLVEARNAVAALRDDVPSLPSALMVLAERYRADHHGAVEVVTTGRERPLPPATTVALVGVAREAITNVTRHAPGASVRIELSYGDDSVRLEVRNEVLGGGRGEERTGYGLTGMRERLALVGGTLHAGWTDGGRCWRVTAEVPA
ncbi:Signal transduction histidine kinase [Streptoalloteichus tenebrarius]|uniref:histidine kinase n=1 Tax=Streptoalloteichus tenebrarius (strain ATCC 17920 / DSM 40477 / JCM 4838 / CBS 697.72 / NBRC 16177 / NCIMB 11028 / NRRL B-12390 / A12253. 1 / ISP 5477) TaxID=1933 RepID=A0ABT1HPW7_STRSD|nr:histidine kinase [Streptoalloteichus tenebrarius]MCP2257549.1 Signal transduction histidine kinase [Streptoalloteichus tenebrarius]BFE98500.1 histidine kinase [Streptoalloteichus tenebrarius]